VAAVWWRSDGDSGTLASPARGRGGPGQRLGGATARLRPHPAL